METPAQTPTNKKKHLIFIIMVKATGKFTATRLDTFQPRHIKSVPIKNKIKEEPLRAYQLAYQYYWARGFKPKVHMLDNQSTKLVEQFVGLFNPKWNLI